MIVLGIDEVGRGSLAGPLVVGAVALDFEDVRFKDSKQLSAKSRQQLNDIIYIKSLFCSIGSVSNIEIDKIGLTNAMTLAINRALKDININNVDSIIIDGSINYLKDNPKAKAIIRADSLVSSVSAASIVAKVYRDSYMIELAKTNSLYGFEFNKGYGTATHIRAINKYGYSSDHRLTYRLKKLNKEGLN